MKSWSTLALLAACLLPNVSFANVYGMPGYGLPENGGDAYQVCESMTYSSDRASCISVVAGNYFDRGALETCRQVTYSSDKLNCLRTIANQRFDNEAVNICSNLTYGSDRNNCLQRIANLAFDGRALRVCAGVTYSSDKISCLERAGYPMRDRRDYEPTRPMPMPQHRPSDSLGQILLDAIDIALRDILEQELSGNRGSDLCTVENSSGRVLGQVRASRLEAAGSRFAREQRSCVVTNISGVTRTRALIGPAGNLIGNRLTENETAQLKNRMGFDRCRILTCRM